MRDEDLAGLWSELGIPGLIDVHVHFMMPEVLAKVWAYFDSAGPLLGRQWPIKYRFDDEQRVELLRSFGVKAFSGLSYAHRPGVAQAMNAWNAQFADRHDDNLRSATFFPEPEAADYVSKALADGVQVFKAHVQVGNFSPADPLLDPVWAMLSEAGVHTVLHAGSGPVERDYTGPGPVAEVLARHPKTPLVIAHLGMPEIDGFTDLAERYDNVYLDTTMTYVDFGLGDISNAATKRLAGLGHKILFGSDFPNIPYEYAHQVEVLMNLDMPDGWLRQVLWENAAKLFGISGE